MQPPARFLAQLGRRLGRRQRALLSALRVRLGRGRPGLVLALGRRLDRRQRALLVLFTGIATALGVSEGASYRDADGPSPPARTSQAAGEPALVAAAAASEPVAKGRLRRPRRGGPEHYRRTARRHVPAKGARAFLPLYREAEREYGVNWRLIASIHRQETAFSTAPSTYHGLNDFGCCAGPMQFNVTNGPVSTWERYRNAFRDGRRPEHYPHRTRSHPSIYDDFDAIMAAGSLLADSGAGPSLDGGSWTAAYAYYGHDLYGVTYASEVLARAEAWQRDGFCPNCSLDEGLVEEFDNAYGAPIRAQLIEADRRKEKHKKRKKEDPDDKAERRRKAAYERARRRRERHPSTPPSARRRRPTKPAPRRRRPPPTQPAAPPPAPTQPAPPTAPPPPPACTPVSKLLGC